MSTTEGIICIVEDVKPIMKLLTTILEKHGFQTIGFSDGKTSIEWLQKNTPLAVVLDILLPDINGTEILSIIRQQPIGNTIPIIAVTGFAQASDRDKYLEMGFDSYIAKPINTSTFPDEIRSVIEAKKGRN